MNQFISASIVLYNSDVEQIKLAVNSFAPSANRFLYLIDNSPIKADIASIYTHNVYIFYHFVGKNLGYGAGHNIALKMAIQKKFQYHIIMNPDIQFESKIIDELMELMDSDNNIAYVMPKILNENGELQFLCKLLPVPLNLISRRFLPKVFANKIDEKYVIREIENDIIINPPCLSGCFMFLRMPIIEKYNLFFDERFFMYCEDIDLIRRLHRIGKTIYYPKVSVFHEHAKESYKSKKMFLEHIKSAIRYFNKYGWFFDEERKRMNNRILDEIKVVTNDVSIKMQN
jgi:GT2 family glycosyltransferase